MRIKEETRSQQIIKKSRFIGCLMPVRTEEAAISYIASIRKEFTDATHVCTACIIGENGQYQHSSDNKEPAGTAGVPMLEVLKKNNVTDICACTVRYFGGIKLGAGGLTRAYSSTAAQTLEKAQFVMDVPYRQYLLTYPYEYTKALENMLRKETVICDMQYSEQVSCLFEAENANIEEKISALTRGQCRAEFVKTVMLEKEIQH